MKRLGTCFILSKKVDVKAFCSCVQSGQMTVKLNMHSVPNISHFGFSVYIDFRMQYIISRCIVKRGRERFLQVIFRGTYRIRFGSVLSKEEEKDLLINSCRLIEGRVLELFARRGWNFRNQQLSRCYI